MDSVGGGRGVALLLAPAALTIFLAFNSGGFFVGATAVAALALLAVLLVWLLTTERPLEGIGWRAGAVVGALGLYAVWVLASGSWSDSPARATLEFDRALLYLLAFLALALPAYNPARLRWTIRALVAAIGLICVCGLVTRVAPDLWSVQLPIEADRLSYPLTYWNGLGMLAAAGIVLSVHLTAALNEPPWVRLAAAGLVPALAATLFFTLSRGAILALAAGLLAYVCLGRPRGLPASLLAVPLPTAVAVIEAYGADRLTSEKPTTAAAVAQGHDLALVLAACTAGAVVLRAVGLWIDGWLEARSVRTGARRGVAIAAAVALLVAGAGLSVALDAPGYVQRQYDRFLEGTAVDTAGNTGTARSRLTDAGNNGRIDHWRVALDAFRAEPLRGAGAGTYQLLWARDRPASQLLVVDAHSLYVETLAELGIVGLVLVAGATLGVLALLLIPALRWSDPAARALHAAVFAAVLAWVLHASIDWDWELPAVSLWAFALAGAAVSASRPRFRRVAGRVPRVLAGVAILIVAVTPARAALSQQRLDRSIEAFRAGDCGAAIDSALDAASALSVRPEPWEMVGYCDARLGYGRLAAQAFRNAIARDPLNWEAHYGLALAQGSARRDPRPAIRRAKRLNPRGALVNSAAERFDTASPARWEREARASRIPLP